MSGATRLGLGLLGAGLVLGLLADALLRVTPLGVNVPLWAVAFAAAATTLVRWQRAPVGGGRPWLLVPFLVFAALLLWRDSPWLAALNLAAVVTSLALALPRMPGFRLWLAGVADYAAGLAAAVAGAVAGAAVTLFQEIGWRELPRGRAARYAVPVARGLALAVPLLVVFGALFVAADAVFEDLLRGLAPGDGEDVVVHVLVVAAWAWLAIGVLRALLLPEQAPLPEREGKPRFALGNVELAVVFALLDLLFLAFVLVQLRYLFGGAAHVEEQTGLTYAEYARQGFFELVVVAGLVLPLLLVADWARGRGHPRHEWIFRALAGALVVLLFVVMASALERLRLYQSVYGLTQLRVYTTGFILWLAVVFAWACATVLRGRRQAFAVGAVASGFVAILALNVLNPDALIVRTNVHRPSVDYEYLARLSDDAMPTLVAELPRVEPRGRAIIAADLRSRRYDEDWRTWNLARARARDALSRPR